MSPGGPRAFSRCVYSVGNQLSREGPIDGIGEGVIGGIVGAGARFRAAVFFLGAVRRRVTFARVRRLVRFAEDFMAFPFRLAARFLFATLCPPLIGSTSPGVYPGISSGRRRCPSRCRYFLRPNAA